MTSLLFVYVVFGPILHIFIIQFQDAVCLTAAVVAIDVFLKSFILVSTYHQRSQVKRDSSRIHRIRIRIQIR